MIVGVGIHGVGRIGPLSVGAAERQGADVKSVGINDLTDTRDLVETWALALVPWPAITWIDVGASCL